mmetsp:Transcript_10201/g.18386  ORF Transcript_10201/g.18386 Transcript_10201/m.18386 type:complete len:297 (-) Transcript_10201:588-1478(-)
MAKDRWQSLLFLDPRRVALVLLVILSFQVGSTIAISPSDIASAASGIPKADDVGGALQDASVGAIEKARLVLEAHRALVLALCIPFGLVLLFAGFWILNPAMFLASFCAGGFLSYIAVFSVTKDTSIVTWASFGAFLLGGLLCGFLSLYLVPLGIFLLGGALGIVFGLAINSIVSSFRPETSAYVLWVLLGSLAIVFGFLSLRAQNTLVVVATAYGGAFLTLYSAGFFLGHFPDWADVQSTKVLHDPVSIVYFVLFILLGTTGCLVQYRVQKRMGKRSTIQRRYFDEDDEAEIFFV